MPQSYGVDGDRGSAGRVIKPGGWFPGDAPLVHVATVVAVDGGEPAPFNEDLRQAQGCSLVSEGTRPEGIDLPRGDGGLGPVIDEPVQQPFDRGRVSARLFDRLFNRWPPLSQPVKDVRHYRCLSICSS
jgi:hypothetical protein